ACPRARPYEIIRGLRGSDGSAYGEGEEMSHRMWGVVVALALVVPVAGGAEKEPSLTARAAILVDGGTGAVVWARDADTELPPASTTKVMTAILALESGELGQAFPASLEAGSVAPTKLDLRPGQRLNLRDLVYAILLNSANDAS